LILNRSIGGRMRHVETDVARADAAHSGLSTAKKMSHGTQRVEQDTQLLFPLRAAVRVA
jgi:hypothetical protein